MIEPKNEPAIMDLDIEIGRYFAIPFIFSDEVEINIADFEFKSQIRDLGGNLIAEFTIEKDEFDNSIELRLEAVDTAINNAGRGKWDLAIIEPPQTLIQGEIRLTTPVTELDEPEQ